MQRTFGSETEDAKSKRRKLTTRENPYNRLTFGDQQDKKLKVSSSDSPTSHIRHTSLAHHSGIAFPQKFRIVRISNNDQLFTYDHDGARSVIVQIAIRIPLGAFFLSGRQCRTILSATERRETSNAEQRLPSGFPIVLDKSRFVRSFLARRTNKRSHHTEPDLAFSRLFMAA